MDKKQIFMLHFAGGNVYSFDFLKPFVTDFEMIPLELPGRGKRIKEKLLVSYSEAVKDVYKQISSQLKGEEFIIYGHSLGASLAIGVTDLLEKNNKIPQCVIVSGNAGPRVTTTRKKRSSLERKEFIDMLKELGGLPKELLESEELLDFVLPIIRSDFKIVEEDFYINDIVISSPIAAVMGNKEKHVGKIDNWKNHTKSNFMSYVLNGNHFFIYDNVKELVGIFQKACQESENLV